MMDANGKRTGANPNRVPTLPATKPIPWRTKINVSQCTKCFKIFTSFSQLGHHMNVHAPEKAFACETCGKRFSSLKQLGYHMKYIENPYWCRESGERFAKADDLSFHSKMHSKEVHICQQCGKHYDTWDQLKIHVSAHNIDIKSFRGRVQRSITKTHKHRPVVHIKPRQNERPPELKLTFEQDEHMKTLVKESGNRDSDEAKIQSDNHRTKNKKKKYAHTHCKKSFLGRRELNNHEKSHKGEQVYLCERCGKSVSGLPGFEEHMTKHERLYLCELCGESFTGRTDYKQHNKKHIDEDSYLCEVCGDCFIHVYDLDAHMETHAEEQLRLCAVCGYCLTNSKGFNSHMKLHESHVEPSGTAENSEHVGMQQTEMSIILCELCGDSYNESKGECICHVTVEDVPGKCGDSFCKRKEMETHMNSGPACVEVRDEPVDMVSIADKCTIDRSDEFDGRVVCERIRVNIATILSNGDEKHHLSHTKDKKLSRKRKRHHSNTNKGRKRHNQTVRLDTSIPCNNATVQAKLHTKQICIEPRLKRKYVNKRAPGQTEKISHKFRCLVCGSIFDSCDALIDHTWEHIQEILLKFYKLNKENEQNSSLKKKLKKNISHSCKMCGHSFKSKGTLAKHVGKEHRISGRPKKQSFPSLKILYADHMNTSYIGGDVEDSYTHSHMRTEEIKYSTARLSDRYNFRRNVPVVNQYGETVTDEQFENIVQDDVYNDGYVKDYTEDDEKGRKYDDNKNMGPVHCKNCDKYFTKRDYFDWHICIKLQKRGKTYKCEYCSQKFRKSANLQQHMIEQKHNFNSRHDNQNCSSTQDYLRTHLNTGSVRRSIHLRKEALYQRHWCEQGYSENNNHIRRVETHKVNPYTCQKCGECFCSPEALSDHMETHKLEPCLEYSQHQTNKVKIDLKLKKMSTVVQEFRVNFNL
uniref:Zinc finger protein 585A-like n=1 Tax=Saccoglossus kowalevskii TaxID=10224 RepID=A0ABM0M2Q7_SACKO|nr:PREDICTED: zinc finger protein 585A-like [Saccoglossus kowalevskii]